MINYSFIIPHHNSPDLLTRCLNSIPQRGDIEVIVADDNSDAEKRPVCHRKDTKIIAIDKARSKGAGRARNIAMKEAVGKWLVFADADDFFMPDFLSVFDEYRDENIDVLYHAVKMVDCDTLCPILNYIDKEAAIIEAFDGSAEKEDEIRYLFKAPWWKIVRRELVLKYCIEFEEVPKGNDIFFSFQVGFFAKNIAVVKKPLYVYTYNKQGISNSHKNEVVYFNQIGVRYRIWEFYRFINHPEWITSSWMIWARMLKHDGFLVFFKTLRKFVKEYGYLRLHRHDYVNIIQLNSKKM